LYEFIAKLYQTFKENLTPMFLKVLCKIEKEEMLPNAFYEARIYYDTKTEK
jgi:hypothetical protein